MLAEIFACRRRAFGLMVAIVATVAYLGLEARGVEVQVQLAAGRAQFHHRRTARQGGRREPRAGSRGAWRRSASRCRPSGSRSICRPPTCPRKARISTCRSRLGLLAALGATDKESLSHYVVVGELGLDGRIAPSPGVLLAALHASAQRPRADLPGHPGAGSGLGGRCRSGRGARPAGVAGAFEGHSVASRADPGRGRSRWSAVPTSPRSRGRKPPSARSRSPRRAGTIC